MTESMFTVRLSSVMTGCGGKETTCSRRAISRRPRSTYGTSSARPGSSVRSNRPRRSTTPARACGTLRIERATVRSTTNAIASSTISPAVIATTSSFGDQRGRSLDLHHVDARTGFEHRALVVRPCAPHLAADLHLAVVRIHTLYDQGALADQRRRACAQRGRHPRVPQRDRPQEHERRQRQDDEYGELQDDAAADGRHDRRHRCCQRDRAQEEAEREDLSDREGGGDDRPGDPLRHASILCASAPENVSGAQRVRSRACSTSAIRSSGVSQPTLIRMKPSGTSLPGQRARRSADEWTPPKLVASATSSQIARKRSARSRPPTSKATTEPKRVICAAARSWDGSPARPG